MSGWTWRRLGRALVAPVAVVALASCGGGSSSDADSSAGSGGEGATEYPADVRDNFLTSCTSSAASASGGDAADFEDLCLCVLEAIEADMTIDEFTEAEQAMLAGEASGLDMQALVEDCRG